jgi:hypothetical protein
VLSAPKPGGAKKEPATGARAQRLAELKALVDESLDG